MIVLWWFATSLYAQTPEQTTRTDPTRPDLVIERAIQLGLAQHETWLALLHYKRETVRRRFISQADDERFFLSDQGKYDAQAELKADITAFMRGPHSGHAQCLFPARWWWLKQQLPELQPYQVSCPQLEAYMTRVGHDRLSLVFPTMYLNNPGSTFGHTFLRFDKADGSPLLSHTLNYAARVDKEDDIVSYVSKGLFGGYQGIFRMKRYYQTVQEYSNIENRDIWEYRLDYTPEEIEQLVRHVWELRGIDFDYYFFRENCAYRLLAMLDVIRPGMGLTADGEFSAYAIPVDTVRALDEKALIVQRELRPSLATQITAYFDDEAEENTDAVMDIVADEMASDTASILTRVQRLDNVQQQREALRQAYNILQFDGETDSGKAHSILRLINDRFDSTTEVARRPEGQVSPERGHESIRLAFGVGQQNSGRYADLRLRPAFHDLLDAPAGYIDGAEINVLDTRLKWFEGNDLRLESLRFFNVTSLSPLSRWQKPVSWLLDIRLDRTQMSSTRSSRNFITRGGAGVSYRKHRLTPYLLAITELNVSSSYSKGYSALLGLQAGVLLDLKQHQIHLRYEQDTAVAGFTLDRSEFRLGWQFNLGVDHGLRLSYRLTRYDFYDDEDWTLGYHFYF